MFHTDAQTHLTSPYASVDDFEEELSCAGVENEDGSVDRFGRQVALERLVDRNAMHVGVVYKPNDLVREQLAVVLAGEVGLCGFRGVQLQTLSNTLPQDVESWVCFHNLYIGSTGVSARHVPNHKQTLH